MQKDKKKRDSCEICLKKFGVFVGQHRCKRCLRTVCKDCADKKSMIYNSNDTKRQQHRVCTLCWSDIQYIKSYIKENSLGFNTLSAKGKQWFQLLNNSMQKEDLQVVRISKSIKSSKTTGKQVWKKLNFSIRQLIGDSALKFPNFLQHTQQLLQRSSHQLTAQVKNQKGLFMILAYSLAHAHEIAAIKITDQLLKMINSFRIQNALENLKILQVSEQKIKRLSSYARNIAKQFVASFGIEHLKTDVVNQLISEAIITNSVQSLQAAYAYIIWSNSQTILNDSLDDQQVLRQIMFKTTCKNIQKGLKLIRSKRISSKIIQTKAVQPKNQLQRARQSKILKDKIQQKKEKYLTTGFEKKPSKIQQPLFQERGVNKIEVFNIQEGFQEQTQLEDKIEAELDKALKFIEKMECGKTGDNGSKVTPKDLADLDHYLDLLIDQNEKGLKEFEQLEEMLGAIENKFNLVDEK